MTRITPNPHRPRPTRTQVGAAFAILGSKTEEVGFVSCPQMLHTSTHTEDKHVRTAPLHKLHMYSHPHQHPHADPRPKLTPTHHALGTHPPIHPPIHTHPPTNPPDPLTHPPTHPRTYTYAQVSATNEEAVKAVHAEAAVPNATAADETETLMKVCARACALPPVSPSSPRPFMKPKLCAKVRSWRGGEHTATTIFTQRRFCVWRPDVLTSTVVLKLKIRAKLFFLFYYHLITVVPGAYYTTYPAVPGLYRARCSF